MTTRSQPAPPTAQRRPVLRLTAAVALVLCAVSLTACRSNRGVGSDGHASVTITSRSVEGVRLTAKAVFDEAGYSLLSSLPDEMVFQRRAGGGDVLLYGGWEGGGMAERVRVRFTSAGAETVMLAATAYAVRDAGDRVMEEEQRKFLFSRGPYKQLLGDVKRRSEAP